MIPSDFSEWKDCIERRCNIPLTEDFAKKRLSIYNDNSNPETQRFVQLYGEEHLQNIISWFKQI